MTFAPVAGRATESRATMVPSAQPRVGEASPASSADARMVSDAQLQHFVQLVLGPDESNVASYVTTLQSQGLTVEAIYLDLLAPTARVLGEMWSDDACEFADVTIGVGRLQVVLRSLSQLFVRDSAQSELTGRVLLACLPGEQHSLGLFMVAEFFVRDGWGVHVGPPMAEAELMAELSGAWYDVVGFSVSCDSRIDHLKREIRRVRRASKNRNVRILVGGRAFNDDAALLGRVGADATAASAASAPARAREVLSW
ncbi:MAG: cobalamin-dependent protein [Gemmatimonadota bacterium]